MDENDRDDGAVKVSNTPVTACSPGCVRFTRTPYIRSQWKGISKIFGFDGWNRHSKQKRYPNCSIIHKFVHYSRTAQLDNILAAINPTVACHSQTDNCFAPKSNCFDCLQRLQENLSTIPACIAYATGLHYRFFTPKSANYDGCTQTMTKRVPFIAAWKTALNDFYSFNSFYRHSKLLVAYIWCVYKTQQIQQTQRWRKSKLFTTSMMNKHHT